MTFEWEIHNLSKNNLENLLISENKISQKYVQCFEEFKFSDCGKLQFGHQFWNKINQLLYKIYYEWVWSTIEPGELWNDLYNVDKLTIFQFIVEEEDNSKITLGLNGLLFTSIFIFLAFISFLETHYTRTLQEDGK